jgi:hypothetical protein
MLMVSTHFMPMSPQNFTADSFVCVLHASENIHEAWLQETTFPKVRLVTCLADFAECRGSMSHLWIDARMDWRLPEFSLSSAMQPSGDIKVCIYNCEHLSPDLVGLKHSQLEFVSGDIHPGMLT